MCGATRSTRARTSSTCAFVACPRRPAQVRQTDRCGTPGRSVEALVVLQERFLHDVSHELRTPVTIARGHLELAQRHAGDSPELSVALDELSRIERIIARLLLLAKAGQPTFLAAAELDVE